MNNDTFDVVITTVAAQPGSEFAQVSFVTLPAEGQPQSSLSLTVPLASAKNYDVGQNYTLALTPATAKPVASNVV